MIFAKMASSRQPSTRAASINSSGRVEMNCRIRNTPKGVARNGRISPSREPVSCMLATSTYSGTKVTRPGTINVAMTRAKTARRPRNSSLAKAYPSMEQKIRFPAVTARATITELANIRVKSRLSNNSR
jgi:hypothetical protein